MNTIKALVAAAALSTAAAATAYDFRVNHDGTEIYLNINGDATVEVTHNGSSTLYGSYSGEVSIPAEVTHQGRTYKVNAIGTKAFANCSELDRLSLPATVSVISDRALLGCCALKEITLPENLERIGAGAFAWCESLTSVEIPAATTMIAPTAFDGCRSLDEITVAQGNLTYASASGVLTDIAASTIVIYPAGRTGDYVIPAGTTAVGERAFYGSAVSSIKLPDGVASIGDGAFYFSNSLTGIHIPASVSEIGSSAFSDCFSLEYIDVDDRNPAYASDEGMLYDKPLVTLLQCPAGINSFPDLPGSVQSISRQSFFRCCGLFAVELPEGVTSISDAAFVDCQSVNTVTLPSTINEIGPMAFGQCGSLSQVFCLATNPNDISVGFEVFANTPVQQCVLYVPSESVDLYRNTSPWDEFGMIQGVKGLKNQSIVWEQNLKPEVGDHATLHATASSGLPVTYHVSPLSDAYAVVDNAKITFTDPGKLIITVTQEGNHEYLPASPVTMVIDVKGTQGIDDTDSLCDIRVSGRDGLIRVNGAPEGTPIRVYTVDGSCLYNGYKTEVRVGAGHIYIVRVASKAFKIAL